MISIAQLVVQGLLATRLTVGEIFATHWTDSAHLMLGSPQPVWYWPNSLNHKLYNPAPNKERYKYATSTQSGMLITRLMEDLQEISDTSKAAVINNKLLRLQVDIDALQETCLAESDILHEKDYTFP